MTPSDRRFLAEMDRRIAQHRAAVTALEARIDALSARIDRPLFVRRGLGNSPAERVVPAGRNHHRGHSLGAR